MIKLYAVKSKSVLGFFKKALGLQLLGSVSALYSFFYLAVS